MHLHTHTDIYACMCVCVRVCVCVCMCDSEGLYTCSYTHIYIYICIYILKRFMVLTRSLGELMEYQILRYYQIVLHINDRAFIYISIYSVTRISETLI